MALLLSIDCYCRRLCHFGLSLALAGSLSGCWPLGFIGNSPKNHQRPTAPFTYTLHDSLSQQTIGIENFAELAPGSLHLPATRQWKANNNVDIVNYGGYTYMAYRNAAFHFPTGRCQIFILRSHDRQTWECIHTIRQTGDLREPRFMVWGNKLWLYWFEGGRSMFQFRPKHLWASWLGPDDDWSHPYPTNLGGYVPWRLRVQNGIPLLSAYYGRIYAKGAATFAEVRLYTSGDGLHWEPLTEQPQATGQACEEGEFVFTQNGDLWATIRYEGFGAGIAHAPAGNIGQWDIQRVDDKYDSALLFTHNDEVYLIARRDPAQSFAHGNSHKGNMIQYSCSVKRTALFRLDKASRRFLYLGDLPGHGDTAFAGIVPVPGQPNRYWVVNYSNRIDGPDYWWVKGQLKPTFLYSFELVFAR